MMFWRATFPDDSSSLVNSSLRQAFEKRSMIKPWPVMSIVWCWATMVSKRPPMIKVACRRKIGVGSEAYSSTLDARVLRGAMMDSSSMLKGKLALLNSSIVGIEGSFLRSFTTKRGTFSNGLILKRPVLPSLAPSLTIWPATHGKLSDKRWRPSVKVLMIAGCEEALEIEKPKHI